MTIWQWSECNQLWVTQMLNILHDPNWGRTSCYFVVQHWYDEEWQYSCCSTSFYTGFFKQIVFHVQCIFLSITYFILVKLVWEQVDRKESGPDFPNYKKKKKKKKALFKRRFSKPTYIKSHSFSKIPFLSDVNINENGVRRLDNIHYLPVLTEALDILKQLSSMFNIFLNAKWVNFQLYHGENNLYFYEMMTIMFTLY